MQFRITLPNHLFIRQYQSRFSDFWIFNSQLYICISPRFKKYHGKDPSVEMVKNIANEYQVPFYNFSRDTLFWNHPEYFADEMHLNIISDSIFSNDVTDKIKQSQKQATKTSKENFQVQIKKN